MINKHIHISTYTYYLLEHHSIDDVGCLHTVYVSVCMTCPCIHPFPPCKHTSVCQFICSDCTLSLRNSCYVFHACLLFVIINTASQEVNNVIDICAQHPGSSTAFRCQVGDASHLAIEWMKPFGECLILFGPEVRMH